MGSGRKLGVDIGGVIMDRVNDGTDTSFFGDNYLHTTAVAGAFAALRYLTAQLGGDVHLVSKCGKRVEERTRHWLLHHKFYQETGIPHENVHFCRKRHEKAPICEQLGITHFVDDRLEVLGYLITVPNLYLFRPQAEEVRRFAQYLPRVRQVAEWQQIVSDLRSNER